MSGLFPTTLDHRDCGRAPSIEDEALRLAVEALMLDRSALRPAEANRSVTASWDYFAEWKRIDAEGETGVV
jgi:hypothetical protein